jgi:hypothetical protein
LRWFTDRVPQFALKDEEFGVVPPLMVLPMVVPPSSFLNVLKTIFDDNLTCIIDTGSELSLVEFGGVSPSTLLLEVCSAHKTR